MSTVFEIITDVGDWLIYKKLVDEEDVNKARIYQVHRMEEDKVLEPVPEILIRGGRLSMKDVLKAIGPNLLFSYPLDLWLLRSENIKVLQHDVTLSIGRSWDDACWSILGSILAAAMRAGAMEIVYRPEGEVYMAHYEVEAVWYSLESLRGETGKRIYELIDTLGVLTGSAGLALRCLDSTAKASFQNLGHSSLQIRLDGLKS